LRAFEQEYGELNDSINDLGELSPRLLEQLFSIMRFSNAAESDPNRCIKVFRGPAYIFSGMFAGGKWSDSEAFHKHIDDSMEAFEAWRGDDLIVGILPWKSFRIGYHWIERDNDFLAPWLGRIHALLDVVKNCNGIKCEVERADRIQQYMQAL
jgi:hypothetical protein